MKAKVFYSKTEELIITAIVENKDKVTFHYSLKNYPKQEVENTDIIDSPNVYKEATLWVENRGYRLWSY